MAMYKYEALTRDGSVVKGSLEALDASHLNEKLRARDLYPYRMTLRHDMRLGRFLPERLRVDEFIFILRQLASLLKSGIALHEALDLLEKDSENRAVRRICATLTEQLMQGRSLSRSFRALSVNQASVAADWLEIGEEQGDVVTALESAATQLEDAEQLRQQLLQQMLYPFIVFLMVLGVGALLGFFVLPSLAHTYLNLGVTLPFFMAPLLYIGEFFHQHKMAVTACAVAAPLVCTAIVLYLWQKGTLRTRVWQCCLHVPFLKRLLYRSLYIAFARSLGRLLSSGVRLSTAFSMLAEQKRFQPVKRDLLQVEEALLRGSSLNQALRSASFVPSTARRMIETGEQTGALPYMLLDSAVHYERYLKRQLTLLVRVIEPLSIALLGVLVLFMALSFFVPLLQSYRTFLT